MTKACTAPRALSVLLTVICLACSDSSGPQLCNHRAAISLEGGSCLVFEDNGALTQYQQIVQEKVRAALSAAGPLLPVTGTVIRVAAGTSFVIPEIGFGARTNGTREIQLQLNPASPAPVRWPLSFSTDRS